MPITSFTCTSRQARTHRLQWMQASRLTRIAGCEGSGSGWRRAGKRLAVSMPMASTHPQKRDFGSCESGWLGWSAMSSSKTISRDFHRALRRGLHLHAFRRLADARGGKRALALDLHHAGAAVAVGPVAGPRQPAQMRDVDALALGDLPDRLVRPGLDIAPVEGEGDLVSHGVPPLGSMRCARRCPRERTSAPTGAGSAPPGRARRSTRRA